MHRFATLLASLLVTALLASVALADTFKATGRGKSEDAAVNAALNNAVDQAVKQILDDGTYKKHKKKIDGALKGKSKKLVSNVQQDGDPEFTGAGYEAQLSADVNMKALEHEINSLGLIQEAMGNPRIMILYNPKLPQGGTLGLTRADLEAFFDNSYGSMVDVFVERGFEVIDKKSAESFAIQVADSHEIDMDVNKAAAYGLKYNADMIVYYQTVGIGKEGYTGGGAKMFLRAQLINPTTSRIISSKDVESQAYAGSIQEALYRAAKDVGSKISNVMIDSIKKNWKKEKSGGGTFIVVLDGVDDAEEITTFRDKLKSYPDMDNTRDRESGGGKTTIEIKFGGSADDVKKAVIKASKELGWTLKLVRAEGSRSTWKRQ
ncbi:MAG: hypothetical protein A2X83_09995 [Desulfuromonadales bacterium GWD2_54_10]|nr:MAG: hypothetical protein A2X83_09995 [Desulfuromonadales bacterium GWD2_54_10]